MRAGSLKIPGFRGGFGVTAALLLATAALAGLSIQSVYREAQVRKRLIADTHRSIAEVVTARLDAAIADEDRAAAAEILHIGPQAANLLKSFSEMEASRPWLQPLVLVASSHPNSDQAALGGERFEELFAAAERAEYRGRESGAAAGLYASAASEATNGAGRAAALNGQARSESRLGIPRAPLRPTGSSLQERSPSTASRRASPSWPGSNLRTVIGYSRNRVRQRKSLWISTRF